MLRISFKSLLKNSSIACAVRRFGRAALVRAATKQKTDAHKQKNNARFAKKILMTARSGGTDPLNNKQLEILLIEAKNANVPKDVIKRNLDNAGDKDTKDFKESLFEFYGHGGTGYVYIYETKIYQGVSR